MNYANCEEYKYYAVANISLELLCAVIVLVIALRLLFDWRSRTNHDRLFMRILVAMVFLLVIDASTWAFDRVTEPDLRTPMLVANFLVYTLTNLILFFLMDYIIRSVSKSPERLRWLIRVVAAACLISEAILIVSQFNGMLYFIDAANTYRHGPLLTVQSILYGAVICFVCLVIASHKASFREKDFLTLFSYMLFMVAAIPIQLVYPDFMLSYVVTTVAMLIIYTNIHLQHERRLKEKELELANAHAAVTISQIQPHFLYNTLSVVAALCTKDPEGAKEAVIEFSRYLRGNLATLTQKEPIFFDEEVKHVRTYLSLEKKRFGDKIRTVYDIGASDFLLPALTLQPIVENAVRHGITSREGPGTIAIKTEDEGDAIKIAVEDDGVGFDLSKKPPDDRPHIGIETVRLRLESMCGGSLAIDSEPGRGTTVVIRIPKKWKEKGGSES